jgi:hypothetical protein
MSRTIGRTSWRAAAVAAPWLLVVSPTGAQEPAAATVPTTRAEAIAEARADKVAELWPERQSPLVNKINGLFERGFREGLDSGRGNNGLQIVLGGMRPGQGFSSGLGYRRSDLWRERLGFRTTARGTFQGAYLFDFDLDFQGLRTERTSLRWYTKYESSPDIDYYGRGNETQQDHHTSYAYDDLSSDFDAAYDVLHHVRLGFTGGYLHARASRGSSDLIPIDEAFTPDQIPGFELNTHYTRIGTFVDIDFRDSRTGPRRGGLYGVRYREYWDVDRKTFAFRQTELELQQYLPYFNGGRIVALRSRLVLTYPKEGNRVPVYLQPVLGGNDDLRGYGGYRFRDNHSLYLGAEHRWHVAQNLEMAAFVDAGKVVSLKRDAVDPTGLYYSGGLGLRIRARSAVISRIDFAVSPEGVRAMWTFSDIYKAKW